MSNSSDINRIIIKPTDFLSNIVALLVCVGITCAWAANVIIAQSSGQTQAEGFLNPMSKPVPYYIFHGSGIIAIIAAGILAGIRGEYKKLSGLYKWAFWILQVTGLLWALMTLTINDLTTFRAFGATGPFVWIATVLIFAGMDRSIWKFIEPLVYVLAVITAIIALALMVSIRFVVLERWSSPPVIYMVLLMWLSTWVLTSEHKLTTSQYIMKSFPFFIFLLTALVTKTRSYLLLSIMTIASLFILDKRRKSYDKTRRYKYVILYLGIMIILLALLLYYEDTSNIISGLWGRAFEDTRSGQYLEFFSQVPIADLLLGRGPTGTWTWQGRDYQYFDNAYIWMAIIGGLPILVSYFIVTIWPGIKAYILRAKGNDAAAANYIMLMALAFTGFSTYLIPSLSPQIYLLYLMTGRCLAYLAEIRSTIKNSINRSR